MTYYGWRPQDFEVLGWTILTVAIFGIAMFMAFWDNRRNK